MRLLYLDFDEPLDIESLERRMINLSDMVRVDLEMRGVHQTKRGYHVIIAVRWRESSRTHWKDCPTWENTCHCQPLFECQHDVEPLEVVCLQLLLGSDPKREAFNLLRAHNLGDAPAFWRDRWNVLYAEKITE